MSENNSSQTKKDNHIQINLTEDISSSKSTRLEDFQLIHQALPELDLAEIDPSTHFLNRCLSYPFLISSMTGGTPKGEKINKALAEVAQAFNIGMGVGSQRIGLEHSEVMHSFKVRDVAPDILLLANLGAVQLNNTYSVEHCRRAVDAINADGLILHLNPLQEAVMDGGDTNFSGLLKKISEVCKSIEVPVIVKEVGWGINAKIAKKLIEVGVRVIDVAGTGGTSWSQVEKFRSENKTRKMIADAFKSWGLPTADAIQDIRHLLPEVPVIASGGIKDGVDAAKCIALGANMIGIAGEFIRAAALSKTHLYEFTKAITQQFKIAMFCTGTKYLSELNHEKISKIKVL